MNTKRRFALILALLTAAWGCGEATGDDAFANPDEQLELAPEFDEGGKLVFFPVGEAGKADAINGPVGLPTSVDTQDTAVWEIRNQWRDTNTAEARLAGMAWEANSGLTWDQKYSLWIQSMRRIPAHSGWGETFEMITPYGKVIPAPALECAETALFLRATFASWYGLPFFVEASDANGRLFLGHFGFRTATGRYGNTPNFKTAYRDYSNQATTWQRDGWPSDATLRTRRLGGNQDDAQPFISENAYFGTYADELFLNKRVGYFAILLLSYFGSVNLADPANLFNVDPSAIRAGDPLVKRYQRTGIGHVYVNKSVQRFDGFIEAELMSGSMPRRQPRWESAASSESAFTSQYAGGPGTNEEGDAYAALGGGLKRWRTPVVQNGRWVNIVPALDAAAHIDSTNHTAIAGRIDTFQRLLGERSPEERRDALLEQIASSRQHLRSYPASCSARERREEAFTKLYTLMSAEYRQGKSEVDKKYRKLEDYAFAELDYNHSRTCCWNRSTANMAEIVLLKAAQDVADHTTQTCHMPTVFKAEDGGYEVFAQYAQSLGRGNQWVAWSEDEPCPQRTVTDDAETEHLWTPWCQVGAAIQNGGTEPTPDPDPDPDPDPTPDPEPAPDPSYWDCGSAQFARH